MADDSCREVGYMRRGVRWMGVRFVKNLEREIATKIKKTLRQLTNPYHLSKRPPRNHHGSCSRKNSHGLRSLKPPSFLQPRVLIPQQEQAEAQGEAQAKAEAVAAAASPIKSSTSPPPPNP